MRKSILFLSRLKKEKAHEWSACGGGMVRANANMTAQQEELIAAMFKRIPQKLKSLHPSRHFSLVTVLKETTMFTEDFFMLI
jgi:hypothetical protein